MLRIDRQNKNFSVLDAPSMADVSITERYDLQEFICNSSQAFFREIGRELFLLGKELEPSQNVQDRIDLLAIDKEGTCVVIELKRGTNKLHLFQAVSYAAMISEWEADDFFQSLDEDQQEELSDFLEVDREEINRQQSIVLIAEAFDYALLVGAEWLSEQYGVDITCCRVAVAKDPATNAEYLVCSNVYPALELAQQAVPRGRKARKMGKAKWPDWDTALAGITNTAVTDYFTRELETSRDSYLPKRILRYRVAGKRRWSISARNKNAYVWQSGRFEDDVAFWSSRLSRPDEIKPVKKGQCLRAFLSTEGDFQAFHKAVTQTLTSTEWLNGSIDDDAEDPTE